MSGLTILYASPGEVAGSTYKRPPSSELAAINPGRFTYGDQLDSHNFVRDIIINPKKGGVQRIDDRHPLYDPLHFVFAYPNGEMGWRPMLKK